MSKLKLDGSVPAEFDVSKIYKSNDSGPSTSTSSEEITIHQRNKQNPYKRMKVTMTKQNFTTIENDEEEKEQDKATVMKDYIAMVVLTMISYYVYYTFWLVNSK